MRLQVPSSFVLMSNNTLADYNSTVTFSPTLTQSGALFHWYSDFDNMFVDARTALVQTKTKVAIEEIGGGNGVNPSILNTQQAFSQSDWNYGKIGQAQHVVGLDNIELRLGGVYKATSDASTYDLLFAGFGILEAPTGSGTKAEWLFEPQVGTNHWGLGLGFEALMSGDDDIKFMIAGNYRYLIPAWETRSFDLVDNGQWSRYLAVQDTYGLPTAPATLGLPGINYFTQQAYINGRSELNLYLRLQKQFKSAYFEMSYNFLCVQKETIGTIKAITPGYGIYALTGPAGGSGGVTTSSTATINQDVTTLDTLGSPIEVSTNNFDKLSAAQSTYATNNVTARLEIHNNNIIYGFGASIESALSASAISTWSVWAQFGILFDNIVSYEDRHEFDPEMYDLDLITSSSVHHNAAVDEAGLPEDVIDSIENSFIDKNDNFEFDNTLEFETIKKNDVAQKDFIIAKIAELNNQMNNEEDNTNNFETEKHPTDIAAKTISVHNIDNFEYELESDNDQEVHNIDDVEESDIIISEDNDAGINDTQEETTNKQEISVAIPSTENIPTPENKTIALDDPAAAPTAENGINLKNDASKQATPNAPTISLDDHAVVIQSDSGMHLGEHKINNHTTQPMSADEITKFLHRNKSDNK